MTAMELQQWRENFIEEYLNKIDNIENMKKLVKYTKSIWPKKKETPRPCVVHSQDTINK